MELGTNVKFHNGLTVRVDWLSFTLKDITVPATAFELLGYDASAFQLLPSGRFGYKSAYTCKVIHTLAKEGFKEKPLEVCNTTIVQNVTKKR